MGEDKDRGVVPGSAGILKPCRECQHEISTQAAFCPNCGAPFPARDKGDGWGFEYKSQATLLGLPLLHISFKYRSNCVPVPAKGIIAIGQFARAGGFAAALIRRDDQRVLVESAGHTGCGLNECGGTGAL